MTDPYWRLGAHADRDLGASFPGYLQSDGSSLTSQLWDTSSLRGTASDYQQNYIPVQPGRYGIDDVSGTLSNAPPGVKGLAAARYGLDDLAGTPSHATPGITGMSPGVGIRAHTPIEDPAFMRRDAVLGMKPDFAGSEHTDPLRKSTPLSADESNILFIDGLPTDCMRREVSHLFRPFIGFKEIRVVHKEPRRTEDKAYVLCFVEFDDAKCALTAMEALQGYKFDDKRPDAPVLRISFAKFPFRPPVPDERRHAGVH